MRSILLAVILCGMATPLFAQTPAQPGPSAARGLSEGVAVHGDWVIEVRNPDGSLSHRQEFKNAFVGQFELSSILMREKVPSLWEVVVGGLPCDAGTCRIRESTPAVPRDASTLGTLNVSVNGDRLVMKGAFAAATAPQGGNISDVLTTLSMCPPSSAPGAICSTSSAMWTFTQHFLATPIPVAHGQIVAVTVTLSFS